MKPKKQKIFETENLILWNRKPVRSKPNLLYFEAENALPYMFLGDKYRSS